MRSTGSGKGLNMAISDGFKNAYSAIIDGNVTTLLTGIVLYMFGSGPIRGFATTLVIGILTSLFSAIFISRLIIQFMVDRKYTLTFWSPNSASRPFKIQRSTSLAVENLHTFFVNHYHHYPAFAGYQGAKSRYRFHRGPFVCGKVRSECFYS